MRKIWFIICMLLTVLQAETLFEVKDSSNNPVLNVSTDGLRVMNEGDTLMVISSDAIRANIGLTNKGLSRAFSVTTTQSKGKGLINALEVNSESASMTSPLGQYTNFSPENIFLGLNAGVNTVPVNETSGENNVFLGNESGNSNTSGASNVFVGYQAGYENLTGFRNCFIGQESGYNNESGHNNVFIGYRSGFYNYDGDYNVFLGYTAGNQNTSGNRNVFIGYEAGFGNGSGWGNTFVGEASASANTSGYGNSCYGRNSGFSNTTGDYNTIVGYEANSSNQSGNYNSCYGTESGKWNYLSGSSNSLFGYRAGYGVAVSSNTYSNNSYFGTQSGYSTTTGSNNSYFGYQSGYSNNTGSRNVFIGYQAGYSETGSDKLYIDNSSTTQPLIYGDFDGDWVKINGDLTVLSNADLTSAIVDQTLRVDGLADLNAGLDVTGNTTISGTLYTSGATTINNTLTLDTGTSVNEFSTDGTLSGNSDNAVPTERAVRTYVGNYVSANGDDLGSHTASQNIRLSGYYLSNDGGNEGVYVDTGGDVGIGTNSPGSNRLKVINSASGVAGAAGYFESTYSTGIGLVAEATSTDAALYVAQKHTSGGNIAKFASWYGGTWHESIVFKNSGGIVANNLSSGTGTALVLTSGNEIVKYSSSRKYKKNIETLVVDSEKFMKLRPVDFVWNERSASEGKKDKGLIAEEVESIDPELAVYNEEGTIEGVDYQKINIMLLKVVQDQQNKIEELEKRISKLEK